MAPAESQELHGISTSSFTLTSSEVEGTITDFETYRQSLNVNWNKAVSPYLSYRISLRGEGVESQTTVDSEDTETSFRLVEPALDVTLATPRYSLNTGLRLRERLTDETETEAVRLSDRRLFARLFLTPEQLPSLSFLVDRTTSLDDRKPKVTDTEDIRYQVSSEYAFQNLNVSYLFSDQIREDNVARRARDTMNHVGNLGYSQSFFQDRLSLLGNYSANYTRTGQEFFIPAIVSFERALKRLLQAPADPTPQDSSDSPVTEVAALNVPLELNVSVGFELVARESVSEIRISVVPDPSLPSNFHESINFRVFFSDDRTLTTWTEVVGAVSQSFDSLENRFSLTFSAPATMPRFFKAFVSQNPSGRLVRATGITALDSEPVLAGDERVSSSLIQNLGAGVTFRPFRVVTASYNLSLTDVAQEPDSRETLSGVHTARLTAEPHRLLTTTLTYQHSFADANQPGVEDTTADTYTLLFSSSPLPTLTSSLSLVRSEDRSEGELERRSGTASLNAGAELYRNLNMDSTFTLFQTEDFVSDQESLGQTVTLNMTAILTSRLSSTMGYTFQHTSTTGPGLETSPTSHAGSAAFTYTLSRLLNLNARFDVSDTEAVSTLSQEYTVDWIPTVKTSLFMSYRRISQRSAGVTSGSDSVALNGRWNISRFLDLNANYAFLRDFTGNTVGSFNSSVGYRF